LQRAAVIFGLGYVGARFSHRLRDDGWHVSAVVRDTARFSAVRSLGVSPILLAEEVRLNRAIRAADAVLVTAPPVLNACPALNGLHSALSKASQRRWVGYLSSTSVYGDQQGRVTHESAELKGTSPEARARITVEQAWGAFADEELIGLNIFRLAGIYGPGRSAIDRLRAGTARRVLKNGHVLSRVHVDDIIELLILSLVKGDRRETYNVSDDEPSPPQDLIFYASQLLNLPPPAEEAIEDAQLSSKSMRFFDACRRISSQRAQENLGWSPQYPSYRQGLNAIMAASISS
jgi:nucleoside-diphosphate-sugar epimerase